MAVKYRGRVKGLRERYKNVPDHVMEYFMLYDPSDNNKYLEWLLKMSYSSVNGVSYDDFINMRIQGGSLFSLIELVTLFHENNQRLTGRNVYSSIRYEWGSPYNYMNCRGGEVINPRDINTYQHPMLLRRMLEHVIEHYPTDSELRKERIVLHSDKDVEIIVPLTTRASCKYGSGTRWCTAGRSNNYFNRYTVGSKGLVYLDFKKPYARRRWDDARMKVALHWKVNKVGHVKWSWFYTDDTSMSTKTVFELFGDYMKHTATGDEDVLDTKAFYFKNKINKAIKKHIRTSNKLNWFQRFVLWVNYR
jgi:hypothetical protein